MDPLIRSLQFQVVILVNISNTTESHQMERNLTEGLAGEVALGEVHGKFEDLGRGK